jgi:phosphatidylinositol kinase/protein kinase (PI-3  family)
VSYYLLQLVQALKYEKNIDNPLARFLLEQAVIHPVTIGHELFWHLRAEMYNPEVQKRYGLYLEVFLNKISEELYKIFKDEDYLLKELVQIAIKVKEKIPKEERNKRFKEDLEKTNNDLVSKKKEISLPLNFKYRIRGINYDKCRVMKSKKKPLWLTFKNADPLGEDIVVMLKCGDDLRMDMVTLQLFHAMQTLWFDNSLNLKMSLYKIICTGNQQGMLEMVTNSETLANIHVKEGGAISQFFSKEPIKNWIEKNCVTVSKDEAIRNFMISNVAYCLATFVLGIGDRHNDNIMLKKNGELFHIDFGHFLGHFKYKMGIKRERAPFVFTRQFQNVLGNDNSELFREFKDKLHKGYIILRNNRDVIVTLLRILLCTGIPELNEKSLRYLEMTLAMKKEDKEADDYLEKQLADSLDSVSTKLNFAIHIVANK